MPEKTCLVGDCIWSKHDSFCDALTHADIPLDKKWPLVVLYLRGIKEIKNLSEVQKAKMQEILLAVLRTKDYSQSHYDAVQESIFSVITLPIQEKLDQILKETAELAKDMHSLFGKHQQEVSTIVQGAETGLVQGKDPVFLLSEIRGSLKDVVTKMKQDADVLVDLSHTDMLTGLGNRRCFDEFLDRCVEDWKTTQTSVSLIMFDVDHFKNFNDTYGHLAGDQVLRALADQVRDVVAPLQHDPSHVLAARFGGDEFVIVLSGPETANALQMAESLRRGIQRKRLRLLDTDDQILQTGLHITISVGVADLWPKWGGAYQANLVHCADKALYHAKNNGRNVVARYTPEDSTGYTLPSAE